MGRGLATSSMTIVEAPPSSFRTGAAFPSLPSIAFSATVLKNAKSR